MYTTHLTSMEKACSYLTAESTVVVEGDEKGTYTFNPAKLLDHVPEQHYEMFTKLCAVGTATKYPRDERATLDVHPVIYSILLLCRAFDMPEYVIDRLTDGLIDNCMSYSLHHDPQYIWLVKSLFGRKRGRLGVFIAACSAHCLGIEEGKDADGYPIPKSKYGIANFIIESIKLLRKKVTEGVIGYMALIEFMDKISRMNMDRIYRSNTDTTRENSRRVRNERNLMRDILLIKVGDPLFPWTVIERPAGMECYTFPHVHVPGLRKLKPGDKFIVDLEVAKQRMLDGTSGIDIATIKEAIASCGGLPSKAISNRLVSPKDIMKANPPADETEDEDCPLLENTDWDIYGSCGDNTPDPRHNAAIIDSIYRLIRLIQGDHKAVIGVVIRRSVLTLFRDDGREFQFITTSNVNGARILCEFDFSQCKVEWRGGTDFYMTPDAYKAFAYGATEINTVNGYDPSRVAKTTLAGFDIVKSEAMDNSRVMRRVLDDPTLYEKIADSYLYNRITYEPAGKTIRPSDFNRLKARLADAGKEFAFLAELPPTDNEDIINKAITCMEFRPSSFRRTYGPTDNVNVSAITRAALAKLPDGNQERYLLRKCKNGRQFNATFSICNLESITQAKDGSVLVKVFTARREAGVVEGKLNDPAAIYDVIQLLEHEMITDEVTKSLIDSEGIATFTISKERISRCKSKNICVISTQHGLPRSLEDYLSANVKYRTASGEFNIRYTKNGEHLFFEFDLRNLRVFEEYVHTPISDKKTPTAADAATAGTEAEYEDDL